MRASTTRASCSSPRTSRLRFMIQATARDDPATADDGEAFGPWRAPDDLQRDRDFVLRPVDKTPGMAAVGEDALDEGEGAAGRRRHALRAVALLNVGGVNLDGEKASVGVGHDAPPAPVDASSWGEAFASALLIRLIRSADRPAVDDGGAGGGVSPGWFKVFEQLRMAAPRPDAFARAIRIADLCAATWSSGSLTSATAR